MPPHNKKAARNHRLTPKQNEISDEFGSRRERSSTGRYFGSFETSICLTPTLLTLDQLYARLSQHRLNQNQGILRRALMQSRAGEKIKTQTFQQSGVSVFLLQHWRLRFKARGTQDIEPDWLGLTPLMWAAEGVRPHLDRMMKFRLYLYPHATLHHCRYDSPRSICFQGERGRWIVMYLRWPACKHSYLADHVVPLMHVKYWVGLFGVLGFSGLAFIHLFHLFVRVLRLAKFDLTRFRMTPVRLHRRKRDPADCVRVRVMNE